MFNTLDDRVAPSVLSIPASFSRPNQFQSWSSKDADSVQRQEPRSPCAVLVSKSWKFRELLPLSKVCACVKLEFDSYLGGRTREGISVGSQSRLSCPPDRGGGTLRRRGADFLGFLAPATAGSSSGPSVSGCSWRVFHDVPFYCCDLSRARMCQERQGRS